MNFQPVEQINAKHLVPTEMRSDLKADRLRLEERHQVAKPADPTGKAASGTSNVGKLPNGQLVDSPDAAQSSRRLNGQSGAETTNSLKFNNQLNNHSTASYLDTSYQNDNSVYYTPAYKVNNHPNTNHRSLIEPATQPNTQSNTLDCSFDNSIVPVASSSSLSSRRSSVSSAHLNSDHVNTAGKHKRTLKRKDDPSDSKRANSRSHNASSNRHHSSSHRRHRNFRPPESELSNYHLESSNELQPPNQSKRSSVNQGAQGELTSSQAGQTNKPHRQHAAGGHGARVEHAGDHQFDRNSSDLNNPLNTDDDSVPYFQGSSFNQDICNRLRWKLKYYFMNPIDKWKAKKKFPWKLLLQIIKIIFVTIHVLTYGSSMARFLNHQGNMAISFRELLLNNWDPVREVMAYPPAAGAYAVYTIDEFYDNFNEAIKRFAKITKTATGSFGYLTNSTDEVSPIEVCFKSYVNGTMNPSQFEYEYNNQIKKKCYTLDPMGPAGSPAWEKFKFEKYLSDRAIALDFNRIIEISLHLPLRTIYLNNLELGAYPECYDVKIKITYDNSKHDGQLLIDLKTKSSVKECKGNLIDKVGVRLHKYEKVFLRILVVVLCIMSFTLCTRSLIKSHKLGAETKAFFKQHFRRHLTLEDQMEFYDFWIVTIIVNDIFIIIGTILQQVHSVRSSSFDYTTCTMFLGIGIFLVWTGILRWVLNSMNDRKLIRFIQLI